jgi:hypothetical protein
VLNELITGDNVNVNIFVIKTIFVVIIAGARGGVVV